MMRRLLAGATILLSVALVSCGKKTPTLNLLVWEGYADPSYVRAFEVQNHCKVSASYMGSSDELVAKLRGGSPVIRLSPRAIWCGAMVAWRNASAASPVRFARMAAITATAPCIPHLRVIKRHRSETVPTIRGRVLSTSKLFPLRI